MWNLFKLKTGRQYSDSDFLKKLQTLTLGIFKNFKKLKKNLFKFKLKKINSLNLNFKKNSFKKNQRLNL